jgi:hypothetical protein
LSDTALNGSYSIIDSALIETRRVRAVCFAMAPVVPYQFWPRRMK